MTFNWTAFFIAIFGSVGVVAVSGAVTIGMRYADVSFFPGAGMFVLLGALTIVSAIFAGFAVK